MHYTLLLLLFPIYLSALLTPVQQDFYETNGFLLIPNFYTEEECDLLKAHVGKMVENFDETAVSSIFVADQRAQQDKYFFNSGAGIGFFFEKDAFTPEGVLKYPKQLALNKMGHAMHDLDPVFSTFSRHPKLANVSKDLGVKDPLLLQSMYIFKQPYIGGEVVCHQDSTFIISEPNTTIGYWVAIEDATTKNGCLWAIPGDHKCPLKALMTRTGDATKLEVFDSTPWDNSRLIPLEVKKGTLIVLHGHLPHMSYMNTSSKSRHAFTLHVMDASSQFSPSNWLQRPAEFPFKGF